MTKSRTSLAALAIAEVVFCFLAIRWKQKIAVILAAIGLVCGAVCGGGRSAD